MTILVLFFIVFMFSLIFLFFVCFALPIRGCLLGLVFCSWFVSGFLGWCAMCAVVRLFVRGQGPWSKGGNYMQYISNVVSFHVSMTRAHMHTFRGPPTFTCSCRMYNQTPIFTCPMSRVFTDFGATFGHLVRIRDLTLEAHRSLPQYSPHKTDTPGKPSHSCI